MAVSVVSESVSGQMTHGIAQYSDALYFGTHGIGFRDITSDVANWLHSKAIDSGLLTLFICHTSASLVIQENADPDVRSDLLDALDRMAPQDDCYRHNMEGPDDMPAHIRSMITQVSISIPVSGGKTVLGTWQGIYLVEHRVPPQKRKIALHLLGA